MRRARCAITLAVAAAAAHAGAAQAPSTDIYLASLASTPSGITIGTPANVTNNAGYDNQPAFLPDSSAFLFSSNRDGRQTDIYRADVASRAVTQVTRTADNEYSPTIMPGRRTFSTVRGAEQRLWAFDMDGSDAGLAYAHDGLIGYHAWLSPTTLALFILGGNGSPVTLQVADIKTRQTTTIENRIGRSLLVRPGTGALTFIHQPQGGPRVVRDLDPATRSMTTLVEMPADSQDLAWTPEGTLLAGQRAKLLAWRPGATGWTEVADLSSAGLAVISRLAVSPDGRWIAIVAEPASN